MICYSLPANSGGYNNNNTLVDMLKLVKRVIENDGANEKNSLVNIILIELE